jgi:hypothetical protein
MSYREHLDCEMYDRLGRRIVTGPAEESGPATRVGGGAFGSDAHSAAARAQARLSAAGGGTDAAKAVEAQAMRDHVARLCGRQPGELDRWEAQRAAEAGEEPRWALGPVGSAAADRTRTTARLTLPFDR